MFADAACLLQARGCHIVEYNRLAAGLNELATLLKC